MAIEIWKENQHLHLFPGMSAGAGYFSPRTFPQYNIEAKLFQFVRSVDWGSGSCCLATAILRPLRSTAFLPQTA